EIVGYWNSGESGTANTTGTIQSYGNTAQYQGSTRYSSSGSTTTPVRNKVTKAVVIQYVND
ncbi:MAG TPA: hypothetical protein P5525_23475, partial [Candidatus Paceibacterota bacterium]|nr:hypothetical protein [Candidatus Paceibacterota bacterium]